MDNNRVLPKITTAMLVLTHECNLRCKYCFVHKKPEHMTYQTALDSVNFLIKNAEEEGVVPRLNYFGGEPMMMWDSIIVPLTNWIRNEYKKPFNLGITTNGTYLDDEKIEFIKKNKINLLFSIDGGKETQDYNRPYHDGTGSFDSLKDIIPKISANFKQATFRGTIIPPTCHFLFENIMFAKNNGFKKVYMVPNVFEEWDEDHKEVLKNEFNKYIDYYINEYRNNRIPINFVLLDNAFLDIKKINFAIDNTLYRSLHQCQACGKCGLGGTRSASIHPNGNIYGCQEMTSNEGDQSLFYIGNIYTGMANEKRKALMDSFDNKTATGLNCDTCRYNRICDGGCVANNYLIFNDVTINPPMYCWWKQLILEGAIHIIQTLGEEENALFKKQWRHLNEHRKF